MHKGSGVGETYPRSVRQMLTRRSMLKPLMKNTPRGGTVFDRIRTVSLCVFSSSILVESRSSTCILGKGVYKTAETTTMP